LKQAAIFPRSRVTVVAVLNATPDSFSDGGRFVRDGAPVAVAAAVDAARAMLEAGADVIDVGGESTRPGARPVPTAREIARTAPIVEALAKRFDAPISIDTRRADVAEAALEVGACAVNDVSGLRADPDLAGVAARAGAFCILGHLRGEPRTMQDAPAFDDVLLDVAEELSASVAGAKAAGIPGECLAVDPGIGFGKCLADNLTLLANIGWLRQRLALPVLVGASRKSFLGTLTGDPVENRDGASHAACAVAVFAGADGVRVHDVPGARRAVQVAAALRAARREELA
jgi:dihydropteroate synthase